MLDFLLGNDALLAIIAFALVLIPAIFIHELGHFLAAKAVGITVLEFGLGFPPRMVKLFTRGETEYTLNWLPIGGFVRPLGEDFVRPVSQEAVEKDRQALKQRLTGDAVKSENMPGDSAYYSERDALRARGISRMMSVNEATPLARIFFMSAGALANLITGFVIFVIIGLSGVATIMGGSVGIVYAAADSLWTQAGLQAGDLIEKVNGEYFAGSAQFFERITALDGQPTTLTLERAGSAVEVTLTPELAGVARGQNIYVYVREVAPESPAAQAGMQAGDLLTAFNGKTFSTAEDLLQQTRDNLGKEVTLTLLRDGTERVITLVPRQNPPQGQGAIGFTFTRDYISTFGDLIYAEGGLQEQLVPLSLPDSVKFSVGRIGFFISSFVRLPAELISGALSADEARFVSPLGMSQIGGLFLQQSIEQNQPSIILNYIAVISILLGLTQLLPIPMLDGGRILFVLIEIVRGRPIAPEREGLVHLIGMAVLLSLMVLAFINDIFSPVTNLFR